MGASPAVSAEHRETAKARIRELKTLLAQADAEAARRLADVCDHLERAIDAFHLEGIRFRMYTLGHQIETHGSAFPPQASPLLEEARTSLQAAGFKTR